VYIGFHQFSARNTDSFTHAVSIGCGALALWDVPRTRSEFVGMINRNNFYLKRVRVLGFRLKALLAIKNSPNC